MTQKVKLLRIRMCRREPANSDWGCGAEMAEAVENITGDGVAHRPARDDGQRRCVVTRSKRPRAELLRYVLDPEGRVTPDVAERLPGRGVWVTPDHTIFCKAVAGRFKAGFKADINIPSSLLDDTICLLDDRILGLLGMARGAGQVGIGWEQAREFARNRVIGAVVVASDAAPASRIRLERLARGVPVIDILSASNLGRAFGRDQVVNALVTRGKFSDMLLREAARRRGLSVPIDDGAATTPKGEGSKI